MKTTAGHSVLLKDDPKTGEFFTLQDGKPADAPVHEPILAAGVRERAAMMNVEWCAEGTHTDHLTALKTRGYRQCGFAAITHRYTQQNVLSGSMP